MRNKQEKQDLMIKHITSYYNEHGRNVIPTMTVYSFEDICKVMVLFNLYDAMDRILSS
jgi:hypothetical protein